MSRGRKRVGETTSEAWRALREQLAAGKSPPKQKPAWLSLQSIKQHPKVFQHRKPAQHVSHAHVRVLVSTINSGRC